MTQKMFAALLSIWGVVTVLLLCTLWFAQEPCSRIALAILLLWIPTILLICLPEPK